MSKTTSKRHADTCSASVEIGTSLQQLLCALLTTSEAILQIHEDAEQILFDIDFNGSRYLLVKMPLTDKRSVALSPRELEIVRMVAQGHQNKVIAVVLNISSWTVCTHLRRIFAKLGVTSRAAMVARLAEFPGLSDQKINVEQLRQRQRAISIMEPRPDPPDETSRGRQAYVQPMQQRSAPAQRLPLNSNQYCGTDYASPARARAQGSLERGLKSPVPCAS